MTDSTSQNSAYMRVLRKTVRLRATSIWGRQLLWTRVSGTACGMLRSGGVQIGALCFFVLLLARAWLVTSRGFQGLHEHLGGENGNIALALASGRGFSDPFAAFTGPTAWMPPSLPLLLAGLYRVFHTRWLVGHVFSVLGIALLAATGGVLYTIAKERAEVLSARIVVLFYLSWVVLHNFYFIVLTHDVALITFLLSLVSWQIHRAVQNHTTSRYWAVLGGISLLTSPATALAWGVSSAVEASTASYRRAKLVTMLAVALAFGAPWLIRNAIVFHQFIPVKSNLYCDLYVANYVDDDGLWDQRSMYVHPYLSLEHRAIYEQLGERAYVASFKRRFMTNLARDPQRFVKNIVRRGLAVSVRYVSSRTEADTSTERQCKRVALPFMFLAAIAGLLVSRTRRRYLLLTGAVWLAFTLPYVVIGLHVRHVLPATPVLLLMAFFGLDALAATIVNHVPAQPHVFRPRLSGD